MVFRAFSRFALSLLIAAVQIAGVQGSPSPAQGSSTATYSCCCIGECHCTGDCCNHGPVATERDKAPSVRVGAGAPAWQAPNQCGVWQGTLQRPPGEAKILLADSRGVPLASPDRSHLRPPSFAVVTSTASYLRASSPRAPPAIPTRA